MPLTLASALMVIGVSVRYPDRFCGDCCDVKIVYFSDEVDVQKIVKSINTYFFQRNGYNGCITNCVQCVLKYATLISMTAHSRKARKHSVECQPPVFRKSVLHSEQV